MVRTFNILSDRLSWVTILIEKATKKAAKLGVPAPRIVSLGTPRVATRYQTTRTEDGPVETPIKVLVQDVEIEGELPSLAGWTLVAILSHSGEATIVTSISGDTLPEGIERLQGECDHCQINRRRTRTAVVRHTDGTYKVVGLTCLGDFTGADASKLVSGAMGLQDLFSGMEEIERGGAVSRESRAYDLTEILAKTAACIRVYGWASASAVRDNGGTATSQHVRDRFQYPFNGEGVDPFATTEEDLAEAVRAIEWAKSMEGEGDYARNVRTIAGLGASTLGVGFGVAVSILPVYRKACAKAQEEALRAAGKPSSWVGEVGAKLNIKAIFSGSSTFDGNYGTTTVCRFVTEDGNKVTWFASGLRSFDAGKTYKLAGTVKKRDLFRGEEITIVTRAKVALA